MIALHLPKNTTKCSCQEITLPMAVRMQSISHCTFPHILDVTGVMEMLLKPWRRQKYIYGRDNLTILYITFALPWATNLICSDRMFVWHIHKDSKHMLGQKYMLPSQQSSITLGCIFVLSRCYNHALLVTGYDVLLSTLQGNLSFSTSSASSFTSTHAGPDYFSFL